MRTIYATTLPGWFDTKAIAEAKWNQQLQSPSSTRAGLIAEPDNTDVNPDDSKLRTLQKILLASQ